MRCMPAAYVISQHRRVTSVLFIYGVLYFCLTSLILPVTVEFFALHVLLRIDSTCNTVTALCHVFSVLEIKILPTPSVQVGLHFHLGGNGMHGPCF